MNSWSQEVECVGGGPCDGERREVSLGDALLYPDPPRRGSGHYRIDHFAGVAHYVRPGAPPEVAP